MAKATASFNLKLHVQDAGCSVMAVDVLALGPQACNKQANGKLSVNAVHGYSSTLLLGIRKPVRLFGIIQEQVFGSITGKMAYC